MHLQQVVVFSALLGVSWCTEDWTFPPGFKFGAASASYQVEGAWNISDKGENIWDRYTHTYPHIFGDDSNGDVACDSYHLWRTDVEKAAELGLHYYRFSISWSRLLPTGFPNRISEDGKRYYSDLIDGLLEKGIEPVVTLYHFDLPQTIQDLGGWTNPLLAEWFADYARVVFSIYGDRVKTWLTINEPFVICDVQYNLGVLAPGIASPDHGAYLCNKIVLMAHAKAYRVYDEEFRAQYHGEVSIANQLLWFEPWVEDEAELADLSVEYCSSRSSTLRISKPGQEVSSAISRVDISRAFIKRNMNVDEAKEAGRYSHPIYSKNGGWPPAIEKIIEEKSKKKGYSRSLLPAFTEDEIALVRGTFDFYAMNYYLSRVVSKAEEGDQLTPWPLGDIPELNAFAGRRAEWPTTILPIFNVFPEGIRRQLAWLKQRYGNIRFMITENGYPSRGGLKDQGRIDYFQAHLKQLLLAIKEDGINLTHYTAWTLLDNFEWMHAYKVKFGLYEVNFTDPKRTRTPRDSALYYANVIKTHSLNGYNTPTPGGEEHSKDEL